MDGINSTSPPSDGASGLNWWIWTPVAAVLAFLAFGYSVGNTPDGKAKQQARDTIELCRQDQARASLTPGQQRAIASTCEALEQDFSRRYRQQP